MVEFVIWILHSYYENMNIEKEKVFAKVHFTLFYTAILNAFQSVVLAMITRRISNRMWVQTETLEVNHYVEIREEYDRVEAQLQALYGVDAASVPKEHSVSVLYNEFTSDFSWKGIRRFFRGLVIRFQHPGLQERYNNLLTQIRFHELRVHFLQAYQLPLKLSVSDYLKRSEQHVLIKLVHVNVIAWLLLTVTVNLLYFLMGIIATETEDPTVVGDVMTYVFFCGLFLSAWGALLVYQKMNSIFRQIMITKNLWDIQESNEDKDKLSREQRSLFWGSDPKLVIALIQSMQFGYAVALAFVLIFWDTIAKGDVSTEWYLLPIFGFYAFFIIVVGKALPKYTLCTSLAQLMDERRLKETVANFHLEEAKLKRLEEVEFEKFKSGLKRSDSSQSLSTRYSASDLSGSKSTRSTSKIDKADLMFQLVKLDTGSLRDSLPVEDQAKMSREERMAERRRNRRKSVSDGVQLMAQLQRDQSVFGLSSQITKNHAEDDSNIGKRNTGQAESLSGDRRKSGRRRGSKTLSDGVADMAWNSTTKLTETVIPEDREQGEVGKVDDVSVCSNLSDGEHSDIDDVPDIDPNMFQHFMHEEKDVVPMKERAREFFLSRRYIVSSNVIGTMWAFYLVGQRIERFLNTEGIIKEGKYVSFDMDEGISFWTLTGWLLFFVLTDLLLLHCIGKFSNMQTLREKKAFVAAIIDISLGVGCLTLLFVAESKRCCNETEGSRLLAAEDEKLSFYGSEYPAPCSCPRFGSRTYGGLGNIEPFVSLFALRLFRHYFAKRIVVLLYGASNASVVSVEASSDDDHNETPFSLEQKTLHVNKNSHAHEEVSGTAVELWEHVVSSHPEVVSQYGEFSAEVLQLMLGIPVVENKKSSDDKLPGHADGRKRTYHIDKEYSSLSTRAQEIVMAGKLGKDVEAVDAVDAPEHKSTKSGKRLASLKFVVKESPATSIPDDNVFTAPTARLVRSMRRCDRRLLPYLDQWSVVDVVLTRFEMIYLDASNVDNEQHWSIDDDAVFQALSATKGGKGLRLCDVTAGRRIVGHLQLSDIVSAHVVREMPAEERQDDAPAVEVKKNEFWKPVTDGVHMPRHDGWLKTKEDRLFIKTVHSRTLELRFYSDLEDNERHPDRVLQEKESEGAIFKNNAFQWAQTIGRFCGPEQLKQELPHFGEETDEELRDYLVVHSNSEPELRGHKRLASLGVLNRKGSFLNLKSLSGAADAPGSDDEKPSLRRSSSNGDSSRHILLKRHSSVGSSGQTDDQTNTGDLTGPSRFLSRFRKSSANLEGEPKSDEETMPNHRTHNDGPDMV